MFVTRPAKGVQYYRTQFWRVGLLSAPRLPERSGREIHTHVSPSLFNDITRTNLLMRLIIAVSAARRGSCSLCCRSATAAWLYCAYQIQIRAGYFTRGLTQTAFLRK